MAESNAWLLGEILLCGASRLSCHGAREPVQQAYKGKAERPTPGEGVGRVQWSGFRI